MRKLNDEGIFFAIVCILANDDFTPQRIFRTTLFLFEMAGYLEQEHQYVYSSAKNFAGLINSMEIDEL
jgi:hypothetical protein